MLEILQSCTGTRKLLKPAYAAPLSPGQRFTKRRSGADFVTAGTLVGVKDPQAPTHRELNIQGKPGTPEIPEQ